MSIPMFILTFRPQPTSKLIFIMPGPTSERTRLTFSLDPATKKSNPKFLMNSQFIIKKSND